MSRLPLSRGRIEMARARLAICSPLIGWPVAPRQTGFLARNAAWNNRRLSRFLEARRLRASSPDPRACHRQSAIGTRNAGAPLAMFHAYGQSMSHPSAAQSGRRDLKRVCRRLQELVTRRAVVLHQALLGDGSRHENSAPLPRRCRAGGCLGHWMDGCVARRPPAQRRQASRHRA
jgi:hypothetical protein